MSDKRWIILLVFGSYLLAGFIIGGVVSFFSVPPAAIFGSFVVCVLFGSILSLIINHYMVD